MELRQERKISDGYVKIDYENSDIHYPVPTPFQNGSNLNYYYTELAKLLEPNTNMLCLKDRNNNCIRPATIKYLAGAIGMDNENTFKNTVLKKMMQRGIIGNFYVMGQKIYFYNPCFAYRGQSFPAMLVTLFSTAMNIPDNNKIKNHHKFDIIIKSEFIGNDEIKNEKAFNIKDLEEIKEDN
jgi:hypothetical protein